MQNSVFTFSDFSRIRMRDGEAVLYKEICEAMFFRGALVFTIVSVSEFAEKIRCGVKSRF